MIAHNPSDQPCIRGGDSVDMVDTELCQSTDVYLKLIPPADLLGQFLVQSVNTFYNYRLFFRYFQLVAHVFSGSRYEIKLGDLHLFAIHELNEMFVKEVQIQCIYRLKIVVAVLVQRCLIASDKIIVQRDGDRLQS